MAVGATVPLRLAVLMALRLRKTGSLEVWTVEFARAARRRGHQIDVFGREPLHPWVAQQLRAVGAGFHRVDELERHPVRGARRLARSYDVLHLNLFSPRDRAALIAYAAWPARVLFVDHTSRPGGAEEAPTSRPRRFLDRASMVRVAGVAGVSDFIRDRAAARFTLDPSRVRTVYNGVDLGRFRPRETPDQANEEIRVLAVANLIPEKGVHHLLGAVARLGDPRVRVIIIGDGPEAERLQHLGEELRLGSRIDFLGLRDDVAELLQTTDIFVHPAVWAEAFGLTVAEAMAAGCPVVASRVGAIPELVEDGISGLLVPPGDEEALAAALGSLLRDPATRERLGRNARQRAVDCFGLEACVERHLAWCEEE